MLFRDFKLFIYFTYKHLVIFFESENVDNANLILLDKFIPSFKLSKFLKEEGKEKIIKKIHESLEKNKIFYNESLFNMMFTHSNNYS